MSEFKCSCGGKLRMVGESKSGNAVYKCWKCGKEQTSTGKYAKIAKVKLDADIVEPKVEKDE